MSASGCPVGQCPNTSAASWLVLVVVIGVVAFGTGLVLVIRALRALRRGAAVAAGAAVGMAVGCACLFAAALWHYGGTQASGEESFIPACPAWYVAIGAPSEGSSTEGVCKRGAQSAIVPGALISAGGFVLAGAATTLLLERRRRRNAPTIEQFAATDL